MKTGICTGIASAICLILASSWIVYAGRSHPSTNEISLAAVDDGSAIPDTLSGEISVKNPEALRFNPEWDFRDVDVTFADPRFKGLKKDVDYLVWLDHSWDIGPATLQVTGIGNYTGSLSAPAEITKGVIDPAATFTLEKETDMTYTTYPIYPNIKVDNGYIYEFRLSYEYLGPPGSEEKEDAPDPVEIENPTEPGRYRVLAECDENYYYLPLPKSPVCEFEIYEVDREQTALLEEIVRAMSDMGYRPFFWNDCYPETSLYYYQPYLNFHNGKITSISIHDREEIPETEGVGADLFPYGLFDIPTLRQLELFNCHLNTDIRDIAMRIAENPIWVETAMQFESLDLRENGLCGDIAIFGYLFPNLKSLRLDSNSFTSISMPLPETIESISYAHQMSDLTIDLDFISPDLEQLKTNIPTLALYLPYDRGFTPLLNVTISENSDIYEDTGGFGLQTTIYFDGASLNIAEPYSYGSGLYRGPLENSFDISVGAYYNGFDGIRMKANVRFIPYDINFDFKVNVADIQAIINYILYPYAYNLFNFTQADIYSDDRVNAQDLVKMTNLMLSMQAQPFASAGITTDGRRIPTNADGDDVNTRRCAYITVEEDGVYLENDCDVAAIDLAFTGNAPVLTSLLKDAGFTITSRSDGSSHRIIAYSTSGATLLPGRHRLATDFSGYLSGGSLSDCNASQIPLYYNISTGVEETVADPAATARRTADQLEFTVDSKAEWMISDLSGTVIRRGTAEAGTTLIDIPADRRVILVLTTGNGTKTFKL